jgi:uncharacterized membrane protein YccC
VITAILVMQTSVGASLKAALDRLGGTLAGAIFGSCISLLIPHDSQLGLGLAIALAVAPMTLLAAINASFKVAPVTALIVLLPTAGNTAPPLLYAFDRILEIALGNIVGMTVALLVLPARAHNLLVIAAAKVARLNAELMAALIDGLITGQGRPGLPVLHAKIRAALKQAETAADEAARERRSQARPGDDRPRRLEATLRRSGAIARSADKRAARCGNRTAPPPRSKPLIRHTHFPSRGFRCEPSGVHRGDRCDRQAAVMDLCRRGFEPDADAEVFLRTACSGSQRSWQANRRDCEAIRVIIFRPIAEKTIDCYGSAHE